MKLRVGVIFGGESVEHQISSSNNRYEYNSKRWV